MKKCKLDSYVVTLLLALFLLTGIAYGEGCNRHGKGSYVIWDVSNTTGEELDITVFSYRVNSNFLDLLHYGNMLGNGDDGNTRTVPNRNSPYALCGAALYADGTNAWDVKICQTSGDRKCFKVSKQCDITSDDWKLNYTERIFKLNIGTKDGMYKLDLVPPASSSCNDTIFNEI
jgi:hypothetical protein